MKQVIKLSNGMIVTVSGLPLVRTPSEYRGSFEGVDDQVNTMYFDAVPPVRFGPAPDFDAEDLGNWAAFLKLLNEKQSLR
jgi:small nuclear ribonucleoprotein (snRNP)-like protein